MTDVGYYGMNDCLTRGSAFEQEARRILEREGYETQKSTMEDDIYNGVDFWAVGNDGRAYGFDAKAMKRKRRGSEIQDEWAFVEWRNVYGYPGWLAHGCDILVFERASDIVLVRRNCLLDFCKRMTNFDRYAPSANLAEYCLYSRPGRKDAISMFRFKDLDVQHRVYKKEVLI